MRLVLLQVDTDDWNDNAIKQELGELQKDIEPLIQQKLGEDTRVIVTNFAINTISKEQLDDFVTNLNKLQEDLK